MDVERLFRELYPSLFRYLHRLTGEPDAAADTAQEAFVRLLDHPLADDDARRWLFTVATNLVRDDARQRARRKRLLTTWPASPPQPSGGPNPGEAIERTEQIREVRAALDRLSSRDRQMLLLRQEGFRYREIAEVVGVAPGSVGTLLARALRRFKEVYVEQGSPYDARN